MLKFLESHAVSYKWIEKRGSTDFGRIVVTLSAFCEGSLARPASFFAQKDKSTFPLNPEEPEMFKFRCGK